MLPCVCVLASVGGNGKYLQLKLFHQLKPNSFSGKRKEKAVIRSTIWRPLDEIEHES
jgi:hypothetical protein